MQSHISAADIEQWTNNDPRRAQELLPKLIWKLVLSSCSQIRNHHFPFESGIQFNGYDGYLDADSASKFVPNGKSIWEFGTNTNIKEKFEKDYSKRSFEQTGFDRTNATFCFVSSHIWTHKKSAAEIAIEKENTRIWKNVRIYDAADIEMWLDENPSVSIWFSKILGKTIKGVRTFNEYWQVISQSTTPHLLPEFFLEGRNSILSDFQDKLSCRNAQIVLSSDSPIEAVLVLASELIRAGNESEHLFDHCVIVDDLSQIDLSDTFWNDIIFILNPQTSRSNTTPLVFSGTIVIPVCKYDPLDKICQRGLKIEIKQRSRHSFCRGLEKLGYSSTDANQIASKTWMSFMALYRNIANNPTERQPAWLENPQLDLLLPALFVKEWEKTSDGDKRIIEMLSHKDYPTYIAEVERFVRTIDAPIINISEVYACVSASDTWGCLWNYISETHITDYLEAVKLVFSTPDPTYDLPREQWSYAQLLGRKDPYSSRLRKGLIFSLAMLSKNGATDRDTILSDLPELCTTTISSILAAVDSLPKLYTIIPFFPEIAEATPNALLNYLEQEITQSESLIWHSFEPEKDFLFDRSFYFPIIYSLEILLWDRQFAFRALHFLLKIAESSIPPKTREIIQKAVVDVFRFWYPQGIFTKEERKKLLGYILTTYPATGAHLSEILLSPENDMASPIPYPKWGDTEYTEPEVSDADVDEMMSFLAKSFYENITPTYPAWSVVLKCFPAFSEVVEMLFEKCVEQSLKMSTEDLIHFCEDMADYISRHRKFKRSSWAAPSEQLNRIEQLYNDILPAVPEAYIHNFSYTFYGLNPIQLDGSHYEWAKEQERRLENCEIQMAKMVSQLGKDSYFSIASKVEDVRLFAKSFVLKYLENTFNWAAIQTLRDQSGKCAKCVIRELSFQKIISLDKSFLLSFSEEDVVWILTCFDISEDVIKFVGTFSPQAQISYWKEVDCNGIQNERTETTIHIVQKLIEVGRGYEILDFIVYSDFNYIPSIISLLQAVANENSKPELHDRVCSRINRSGIGKLFEKMYQEIDTYKDTIALLELIYLNVLDGMPKCLLNQLLKDPGLFVDLLSHVYRNDDNLVQIDETAKKASIHYRELLNRIHQIPGYISETKEIDEGFFWHWLTTVRSISEARRYLTACDIEIGRILSYSPMGKDDLWPAECVRKYIEKNGNGIIGKEITIARCNQRGIHNVTGGKDEMDIAKHYQEYADELEVLYPKTAKIVREISNSYFYESKREMQRELIGY
ncbi:MAG: hypothetical protein ACI4GD_01935 [Lachnospiraceae bacterium]